MSETMTNTNTNVRASASIDAEALRDARMVGRLKTASAVLLLLLAAASFAAGVPGLLAAGEWARLGALAWLAPIAIDGGLVFFSASAMAWRAETAKASVLGWLMVFALTFVSVVSQISHVMVDTPTPVLKDFVGAAVASMFPLLVLASTRQFEMLRFSRMIDREARRVALADAARVADERSRARKPGKKTHHVGSPVRVGTAALAGTGTRALEVGGVPVEEVPAWVRARMIDGQRPSGETVASMLGKSRATGVRLVSRIADELDTETEAPHLSLVAGARAQ